MRPLLAILMMVGAVKCVDAEFELLTQYPISEICGAEGHAEIKDFLMTEIKNGGGVQGPIVGSELDLNTGRFSVDTECGEGCVTVECGKGGNNEDCLTRYVMQVAPTLDGRYFVCYLHNYEKGKLPESENLSLNSQAMPKRYINQSCFIDQFYSKQSTSRWEFPYQSHWKTPVRVEKVRYLATNDCGEGINLKKLLPVVTFWESDLKDVH